MKKTYTTPKTEITLCLVEDFIAASDGSGTSQMGSDSSQSIEKTEDGNGKAKQYSAWDSWDE